VRGSKWIDLPLLLEAEEMSTLLQGLPLYSAKGGAATFLNEYSAYVDSLKKGEVPRPPSVHFGSIDPAALQPVRSWLRPCRPVIEITPHRFAYSPLDGQFRSGVLGSEVVQWGVKLSYPQLFQNERGEIERVVDSEDYPNTSWFRAAQRWVRRHTLATPFSVGGRLVRTPIRLGKGCLPWVNRHPQLAAQGLEVSV